MHYYKDEQDNEKAAAHYEKVAEIIQLKMALGEGEKEKAKAEITFMGFTPQFSAEANIKEKGTVEEALKSAIKSKEGWYSLNIYGVAHWEKVIKILENMLEEEKNKLSPEQIKDIKETAKKYKDAYGEDALNQAKDSLAETANIHKAYWKEVVKQLEAESKEKTYSTKEKDQAKAELGAYGGDYDKAIESAQYGIVGWESDATGSLFAGKDKAYWLEFWKNVKEILEAEKAEKEAGEDYDKTIEIYEDWLKNNPDAEQKQKETVKQHLSEAKAKKAKKVPTTGLDLESLEEKIEAHVEALLTGSFKDDIDAAIKYTAENIKLATSPEQKKVYKGAIAKLAAMKASEASSLPPAMMVGTPPKPKPISSDPIQADAEKAQNIYGSGNTTLASEFLQTLINKVKSGKAKGDVAHWEKVLKTLKSLPDAPGTANSPEVEYARKLLFAPLKDKNPGEIEKILETIDVHQVDPSWNLTSSKNRSYGGIIVRPDGMVLMRKVSDKIDGKTGYGGFLWTFSKGGLDPGQSVVNGALREVLEETGHKGEVIGLVPGHHKDTLQGGSVYSHDYLLLMHSAGEVQKFDWETAEVRWSTPEEAEKLIMTSPSKVNALRDINILKQALKTYKELQNGTAKSSLQTGPSSLDEILTKYSAYASTYDSTTSPGEEKILIDVEKDADVSKDLIAIGGKWHTTKKGYFLPLSKSDDALKALKKNFDPALKFKSEGKNQSSEAEKWGVKNWHAQIKNLSPEEIEAIKLFREPGDPNWNTASYKFLVLQYYKRFGTLPSPTDKVWYKVKGAEKLTLDFVKDWDKTLKNAIDSCVTPEKVIAYRGAQLSPEATAALKNNTLEGSYFKENGFTPVTLNKAYAEDYYYRSQHEMGNKDVVMLEITVPKNMPAMYMEAVYNRPKEKVHELLLNSGALFKYGKVTKDSNGRVFIKAEVVLPKERTELGSAYVDIIPWPSEGMGNFTYIPKPEERSHKIFKRYKDSDKRVGFDGVLSGNMITNIPESLKQYLKDWRNRVTQEEFDAAYKFTEISYHSDFNRDIRKSPSDFSKLNPSNLEWARELGKAKAKFGVLKTPITIWRGFSLPVGKNTNDFYEFMKIQAARGEAIKIPGWKSFSTSPQQAESKGHIILEVLEAYTGIYIHPWSRFPSEQEFLKGHDDKYLPIAVKEVPWWNGTMKKVVQLIEII